MGARRSLAQIDAALFDEIGCRIVVNEAPENEVRIVAIVRNLYVACCAAGPFEGLGDRRVDRTAGVHAARIIGLLRVYGGCSDGYGLILARDLCEGIGIRIPDADEAFEVFIFYLVEGQVLGYAAGINGNIRRAVQGQDAAAAVSAGNGPGDVYLAARRFQVFSQELARSGVVENLDFVFPLAFGAVVVRAAVDEIRIVAHDLVVREGPPVALPLRIEGADTALVFCRKDGPVRAVATLDEAVEDDVFACQVDRAAGVDTGTFIGAVGTDGVLFVVRKAEISGVCQEGLPVAFVGGLAGKP